MENRARLPSGRNSFDIFFAVREAGSGPSLHSPQCSIIPAIGAIAVTAWRYSSNKDANPRCCPIEIMEQIAAPIAASFFGRADLFGDDVALRRHDLAADAVAHSGRTFPVKALCLDFACQPDRLGSCFEDQSRFADSVH
jgi:hypothetical protein